jgi:hypothetical protein
MRVKLHERVLAFLGGPLLYEQPPGPVSTFQPRSFQAGLCSKMPLFLPSTILTVISNHFSPSENTNNTAHKARAKQCSYAVGERFARSPTTVGSILQAAQQQHKSF